jgi:hypothetical protein
MTEPTARSRVSLRANNPAVIEGHSVHPSYVFDASERDHCLIPGFNNAKIGNRIVVGRWAGLRQYTLSLEERATCPRSCAVWRECYGSKMPVAVRFRHNDSLMRSLDGELWHLSFKHPKGFSVRLHVLGDFPDLEYVRQWSAWLGLHPELHVWGFTAHLRESVIGQVIAELNASDRWHVRFSVAVDAPYAPDQVTTVWEKPARTSFDPKTNSMVCPQEIGNTNHCVTCGICWKPELSHVRILFYGHG